MGIREDEYIEMKGLRCGDFEISGRISINPAGKRPSVYEAADEKLLSARRGIDPAIRAGSD